MKRPLLIFFAFTLLLSVPAGRVSAEIQAKKPIKILLVPGHDDEVWGTQYGLMKEADMNLALATRIYDILKKDKRFHVYISRNKKGYTKEFAKYFYENKDAIVAFRDNAKAETDKKIVSGDFVVKKNPPHADASEEMSVKLYGFNRWANQKKIDAVIHIHFNDYPRAYKEMAGLYEGFTVYYPDSQLPSGENSKDLARILFSRLDKKYTGSNYAPEKGGFVPDQSLIALGSNSTLLPSVRSVLIEYGYIYEKKFQKKSTRESAYKTMASLTAQGIKEYFFE